MSLSGHSRWAQAIAAATPDTVSTLLADEVELNRAGHTVAGRGPAARVLRELVGSAGSETRAVDLVEFGDPGVLAIQRRHVASGDLSWLVVKADFDDDERATTITVREVPNPTGQAGIEDDNAVPAEVLGSSSRDLAEGISLRSFGAAKRVRKHWGQETWLHSEAVPFGFKVIRLRAGSRTSLQYHERKAEVYFVLNGLARLHFRTDGGAIDTAPFIFGTVATVQPLAWHRVEAITDVTLIEASTFDDGSDNVRVEDDYGRASGHIEAEHEA